MKQLWQNYRPMVMAVLAVATCVYGYELGYAMGEKEIAQVRKEAERDRKELRRCQEAAMTTGLKEKRGHSADVDTIFVADRNFVRFTVDEALWSMRDRAVSVCILKKGERILWHGYLHR